MPRAAVLGSPVAHSLSPAIHTAAYAAAGLTGWSYVAHEVDEAGLARFVAGLGEEWRGLSLTMPLKEVAFAVAAEVSDLARAAGAVNTLVPRPDGGWAGENTDVAGLVAALRGVDHGGAATVLGAGATARSAVLALRDLGVRDVLVAARRPEAVTALAAWARTAAPGVALDGTTLERWAAHPRRLVVSTLPPAPSAALAGALAASAAGGWSGATLLDVVYAGWPTPLARAARDHGLVTVSGLDMLVHQAAAQFRLFTGVEADVDAMFAAVAHLRAR